MAKEIRTKESFGGVQVDHFKPAVTDKLPKALNIHISFDEALRLHLGLGQLLGRLNSYNRSTTAGKRSAVNLCLFLEKHRLTINEGAIRASSKPSIFTRGWTAPCGWRTGLTSCAG